MELFCLCGEPIVKERWESVKKDWDICGRCFLSLPSDLRLSLLFPDNFDANFKRAKDFIRQSLMDEVGADVTRD